jgi:hypothetical protein
VRFRTRRQLAVAGEETWYSSFVSPVYRVLPAVFDIISSNIIRVVVAA